MSTNINNNILNPLCERCKNENAVFYCAECNPFHLFCQRCDMIVHSISIKSNHYRKNILENSNSQILNSPISNKNDMNMQSFSPSQIPKKSNFISQDKDNLTTLNNSIPYSEDINSQNNEINQLYTREFVTELKRLFEKEKGELKYKISSLQNNLDRLKSSFQNEIKKLQNQSNEAFQKNKLKEEEMNNKFNLILNEKQERINDLIQNNANLKEENQNLNDKIIEIQKKKRRRKSKIKFRNF